MSRNVQDTEPIFFPEVRAVADRLGVDLSMTPPLMHVAAKELGLDEGLGAEALRPLVLIARMRDVLGGRDCDFGSTSERMNADGPGERGSATDRYLAAYEKRHGSGRRPFRKDGILWPPDGKQRQYKSALDHGMTFALVDCTGLPAELWHEGKRREKAIALGFYPKRGVSEATESKGRPSLIDPSAAIALLEVLDNDKAHEVLDECLGDGSSTLSADVKRRIVETALRCLNEEAEALGYTCPS